MQYKYLKTITIIIILICILMNSFFPPFYYSHQGDIVYTYSIIFTPPTIHHGSINSNAHYYIIYFELWVLQFLTILAIGIGAYLIVDIWDKKES